jgi:hypothetical protein
LKEILKLVPWKNRKFWGEKLDIIFLCLVNSNNFPFLFKKQTVDGDSHNLSALWKPSITTESLGRATDFCASWRYNPFRGKPDTVMRGSLRNVVGLTRPYALPLPVLFWAQLPDLCSMTSFVISLFERLAYVSWSAPSYTQHVTVTSTDCELFIARSPIQILTTLDVA